MLAWIRNVWGWIGNNKDQLAMAFALGAGATTLYQYLGSVEDGRRKETLKYVERSQEARVGAARNAIAKVLLDASHRKDYDTAILEALKSPPNVGPLDSFVTKHDLQVHLLVLIEHYMNLAGCVKAELCDEQLACDFFAEDIRALNNSFRALFAKVWQARDGQNHMAGPKAFADSCKAR